jgi:organic radical activating enzyme
MKPIAIINHDYDDFLYITFFIGTVCNYSCNYCWPTCHDGIHKFPDYDVAVENLKHLLSVYKDQYKKTNVRLHITGGEPTLWPKIGEFAKLFHIEYNCRITLGSNGSRTLRWWKEYAEYFDDIQISVHHEFCDTNHLIEVFDTIYEKGNIMVAAQVLMDPSHWNDSVEIVNILKEHPTPWLIKVKPIRSLDGIIREYTDEQLTYLEDKIKKRPPKEYVDHMFALGKIDEDDNSRATIKYDTGIEKPYSTFDLVSNRLNGFYGWKCNLGIDRIAINYDGNIQGTCGAQYLFDLDSPLNINDLDFKDKFTKEIIKPVKCREIICGCSSDIRITKFKNV